jgi:nucleotide-binding universal stress UspA family protein
VNLHYVMRVLAACLLRYLLVRKVRSEGKFMHKVKKILAPTDLTDTSIAGIGHALETARDASAEVLVYHVIDLGDPFQDKRMRPGPYRDMLENGGRVLDRFLVQHFADCIDLVEVRQAVEFGEPYRNIVRKAAEEGVDMIFMSTHGRTGIDRFMWGSIAEKVVARAPCAVVVVPRRGREIVTAKAA